MVCSGICYTVLMKCQRCNTTDNLTVFRTVYRKDKKYVYYICRKCNTEKQREQYARNPAAIKRAIKSYEMKHPLRRPAWDASKKLDKFPCEVCGAIKTHKHHPDPERKTDVIYLCPLHHSKVHRGSMKIIAQDV